MGYRYRESASPLIGLVWEAVAQDGGSYTDAANEFWGLSFSVFADGRMLAELYGPATEPRTMTIEAGVRSWGVELAAHVFLPGVPKLSLLGELRELPVDGSFFELAGVRFPIVEYDEMETLVAALHAQGVLAYDDAVARALVGEQPGYFERQLRPLASTATGLGPKRLEQLHRARTAYRLLHEGRSLSEAAAEAGYADQAPMTRAMRAISGLTPAQILGATGPFASRP